jgi:hypothetical protein
MGWQTWLNSGATFVQPTASLCGLMSLPRMKVSGYFNALNVVLWELKT